MLMPDYDLEADDWLAHRLRTSLEKRLMQDLMACDVSKALPVNIEMHTANVLSKGAIPFLTELKKKSGRAVLVETPSTDVVRDVSAFIFARDCRHTNRPQMAIAGLNPRIVTTIDD